MTEIWLLYSTFPTRDEALSAARALVEERLIACANIHDGALSVYRWEGEVRQEPEAVLIAKTGADTLERAMARLKQRHSYDVPCIVAWPLEKGYASFMEWVAAETA